MKFVFSYFKPFKIRLIFEIVIKISGTVMDLFLPLILAYIIDDTLPKSNNQYFTFTYLIPIYLWPIIIWGFLMIFCSFLGWLGNIIANRMSASIARDITRNIRNDLFNKIFTLNQSQIDKLGIPSLIYRMSNDTYNIHQMTGSLQRIAIRAPILLIGGILLTLLLDPVLTLVMLAVLPFISIIIYHVTKKSIPLYQDLQATSDQLVTTVREDVSGIRVIKALATEDYEKQRFDDKNQKTVNKEMKASKTMASINPLMNLLLNLGLACVVLFGAYRVSIKAIQPGVIVAFLHYFVLILNAMLSITRIFITFSRASASASRIKNIIDMDNDLKTIEIKEENTDYHIEFNNVSFSYLKVSPNVNQLNFKIKKGSTLGILGPTGSGKTTIINLLMRFYDPDLGTIKINGKDIRSYPNQTLKEKFGVVFQNDILFNDTIYNNLDFGRELLAEDVINASKNAQISKYIESIDNQYKSIVSPHGMNLSGGQKQRLMIARALVGNPEILILDDSSSALDYKTDANLRKAIKNPQQTQIIIAQRISSIKNCDQIIILEDGKISDIGTHYDLMKTSVVYQNIASLQMGVKS